MDTSDTNFKIFFSDIFNEIEHKRGVGGIPIWTRPGLSRNHFDNIFFLKFSAQAWGQSWGNKPALFVGYCIR